MNFLFGVALALIFSEGFITECEGAGESENASTSASQLPHDLFEEILSHCDLETIKAVAKDEIKCSSAVKKIFENRIISICPIWQDNFIDEYKTKDGDHFIEVRGFDRIMDIFENFGHLIKRVKIDLELLELLEDKYNDDTIGDIRHKITEHIIKKYANKWNELHIHVVNFSEFLDETSNGVKLIHFPNVKKLVYHGPSFKNSFDLNSIFPKLESLTLHHNFNHLRSAHMFSVMQINSTCLANVTNLKELKLQIHSGSLQKHELDNILAKNKQISTLEISIDNKIDTLRSIEKHLTHLKILGISILGTAFLDKISTFNMPNLKRLNLQGPYNHSRIIDFINCFENVEILDFYCLNMIDSNDFVKNIGKLSYVNEFIINYTGIRNFFLKEILDSFDKKKLNLKKIKVEDIDESQYRIYNDDMTEINKLLKKSNKPTWTLSPLNREGNAYYGYMILTRNE